jgi:hypothetical protein
MTTEEFAKVMTYIGIAIGKPLSPEAHVVYFDLLGDLPAEALQTAAKRVLLEHKWNTFPSIAELREASTKTMQAEVVGMPPAKAWEIAWKIAMSTDTEREGMFDRMCKRHGATELIIEAIRAFCLVSLCNGEEAVSIIRAQWLKVYEQLADRDKRVALMPPKVREAIERVSRPIGYTGILQKALNNVGKPAESRS